MVHPHAALLEREIGTAFIFPPVGPEASTVVESDPYFRLSVLNVGVFVVGASSEGAAWESLTAHGQEHPSLKIGSPIDMLPGFAVAEKINGKANADTTSVDGGDSYIRAIVFFEPSRTPNAVVQPAKDAAKSDQGVLPLVFYPRKFKPGE